MPLAEQGKLRYYKVNIRLRAEAASPKDSVALFDMTDEMQPVKIWSEAVASHPERPVFFNGEFVVPCGYAGVLVGK